MNININIKKVKEKKKKKKKKKTATVTCCSGASQTSSNFTVRTRSEVSGDSFSGARAACA
jgi:hypothetical protein